MEDYDPESRPARASPAKMSKVPSWISLGFVLGALFVMAIPKPKPAPPEVKFVELMRPKPTETKLTTIEAVFAQWGDHAVWDNDITEVAYWNPGSEEFSEFYEVRRAGSALFFRSIPKLTRRVINHGKPPPTECPLQFTETEEQYREWRETGRYERPPAPRAELPRVEIPAPAPTKIVP